MATFNFLHHFVVVIFISISSAEKTLSKKMDFGLGNILEELAFGLASITTMVATSSYSKYKSIWRNLEKAPILTVNQDLNGAMKQESTLPYAVVTGRVYPMQGEKILDTISGMPAVISKLNVREFRWVDTFSSVVLMSGNLDIDDSRLSPAMKYVPFALANPNNVTPSLSSNDPFVFVDDVSNGEFNDLLVTAKATYVPSEVTLTGLLASVLRGFHSVGVETSESVLPVGTVITVIGEITKLSGGNGFRVSKSAAGGNTTPYILTTKNIMEVKSDVRAQAGFFKVLSLLFGCVTLMTLYAVGKKWLPRIRLRRIQRQVQRERARITGTQGLHDTQICVACLQNPREVALCPCGHVCLCADCSLLIQERCPVCRQTVTDTLPIFLA